MSRRRFKVGRNDDCPCGSGQKFKKCCSGVIDWSRIIGERLDPVPHLSIRGRNILFINRIAEALDLEAIEEYDSISKFKDRFTPNSVRQIHEAQLEAWPPQSDIRKILGNTRGGVTSLYVGNYWPDALFRAVKRHSVYANKLLLVDPFVYPHGVREQFNPISNPNQYLVQTLKNVNIYLSLAPWIEAGIVEMIRTPPDFDPQLNLEIIELQRKKFEEIPELRAALGESVESMKDRYLEAIIDQMMVLGAPESYLEEMFDKLDLGGGVVSKEQFIRYMREKRELDPNVLGFNRVGGVPQMHMLSAGTSYEGGKITASLTDSYLVTDIGSRWKEIEIDRTQSGVSNQAWAPFAKAVQETEFKYLNSVDLVHALKLRKEERLESFRVFLHSVWSHARFDDEFDDANARIFAEKLAEEVREAEREWKQIDQDLMKMLGREVQAGLLAAGPLVMTGYGDFVAAAAAATGAVNLMESTQRRWKFPEKYPAAFFMQIDESD